MINLEILNELPLDEIDILTSDKTEFYKELDSMVPIMEKVVNIILDDHLSKYDIDVEGYEFEISLSYVTKDDIRTINKEYRGKDAVTDVLSFPQFESIDEVASAVDREPIVCLGDVVICLEVAKEQSIEFGHTFLRELIYLYVHSILHLLGYDHMEENDKKYMRCAEEKYMSIIDIKR